MKKLSTAITKFITRNTILNHHIGPTPTPSLQLTQTLIITLIPLIDNIPDHKHLTHPTPLPYVVPYNRHEHKFEETPHPLHRLITQHHTFLKDVLHVHMDMLTKFLDIDLGCSRVVACFEIFVLVVIDEDLDC